jgi:hypothetical protein
MAAGYRNDLPFAYDYNPFELPSTISRLLNNNEVCACCVCFEIFCLTNTSCCKIKHWVDFHNQIDESNKPTFFYNNSLIGTFFFFFFFFVFEKYC